MERVQLETAIGITWPRFVTTTDCICTLTDNPIQTSRVISHSNCCAQLPTTTSILKPSVLAADHLTGFRAWWMTCAFMDGRCLRQKSGHITTTEQEFLPGQMRVCVWPITLTKNPARRWMFPAIT